MKNFLLLFALILLNSNSLFSQTSLTYSKQWKSGTISNLNLIDKHKSTMLFVIGTSHGTGTGLETPLIPTSNEGNIFIKASTSIPIYQTVYAFDEKTLELKHVRLTPMKNLSSTNIKALKPTILENGDVLYFFEDVVKEGRSVTSNFAYAINDGEMKTIDQSKLTYKDMRQASIGGRFVIASQNHNYFATVRSTDGENIDFQVYDKNFKFLYKSSIRISKTKKSTKSLGGVISRPFDYKINLSNDGQTLHFYTIENDKKAYKVRMIAYSKNKEVEELSKQTLDLDELDFFVQKTTMNTVEPVYSVHFDKANDLHIVGFSPTKEKTDVKYKEQVGTFMAYKLSFPDFKVISSQKIKFDNDLITDLAKKNKRGFSRSNTALKFINWQFNDNNEITSFSLRYYDYTTSVSMYGAQVKVSPSGDIYLPVNGGNFGEPTTLEYSAADGTKKYDVSFKNKMYRLVTKRGELQVFEINGDEEKLVKSFEIEQSFSVRAKICENENTLFLRTTKGIVALNF